MNPEQLLRQALSKAIPRSEVRCYECGGLWIIEVIAQKIPDRNQLNDIVLKTTHQTFNGEAIVWKVFLYEKGESRFSVNATLHVRLDGYEDGMHTVYLEAEDCFLDVTEYDGEILLIGTKPGVVLLGTETINTDNNLPLLPFQAQAAYIWLESQGGHYGVTQANRDPNLNQISITIS